MALLQQIIELLSEPPGTVVFHLVTLFALQAVFALALGQWRQNRADTKALQTAVSAAGIFLARVILMLTGLVVSNDPERATAVLPPLEQAVHTATAVFLIWALLPRWQRFPKIKNALLVLMLILVGVMYTFFAQEWTTLALVNTVYNASIQASVWGILQIALYVLGIAILIANADLRTSLHVIILGILLVSHIVHFWNFPEVIPTETNIAYWVRLGQLIAFPLWAIVVYQQATTTNWQRGRQASWTPAQGVIPSLNLFTQMIRSLRQDEMLPYAMRTMQQMVQVTFVGIGLLDETDDQLLRVNSSLTQGEMVSPHNWHLDLFDWPSFRLAFEQERGVELLPNGLGARQLYDLYEELQAGPFGTMLIQPLMVEKERYGLLLLAKNENEVEWTHQERALIATLGNYLAQVLANSMTYEKALSTTPNNGLPNGRSLPIQPAPAKSADTHAVEQERDQLRLENERLRNQLLQAEAKTAQTRQQAYSLAATLEEMDREEREDKVGAL
ncbi:MAG: GAF domain-containing protein, partial [Chloroflexota bacterium]